MIVTVSIKFKPLYPDVVLPTYATPGSAGADVYSRDNVILEPGLRRLFRLGFKAEIPQGCCILVCPRSGLALNWGITVANAPGVIDSDYRGEFGVILINHGMRPFEVNEGDRIAQMVLSPVYQASWEVVESLQETERVGGFGSTGV